MWKTSKWLDLIITVPLLAVGILFLYMGFITHPNALTEDGESLKNFFYIMGSIFTILPLTVSVGISLYYKRVNDNEIYLTQNGIRGESEILYVEQTGTYINELPQVRFLLKITLPDRPPYQIEHKETVNYLSLRSMYTGAIRPVYVDPKNPKNILLP